MRHHLKLTTLLIACALSLAACVQSASVGIPTPDQVAQSQTATVPAANAGVALDTSQPTQPAPTPVAPTPVVPVPAATPQPAPVATQPPPEPTATLVAPTDVVVANPPDTSSGNVVCNQMVTYIVKPGDNLFRIGLRYKTTAYAIARRNGLPSTRVVRSGAHLRILTCG